MTKTWSLVLALGSIAVRLEGAELPDTKSAAAFEKLKGLAGTWQAVATDGTKTRTTSELVASGSTLLERYVDESMPSGSEMITLYHLDGGRLVLTHYCMAGNQPRMEAASFDAASGELQFEFLDATNLKTPADGHMHRARFRFESPEQFTTEWEFFEDGKPAFSEVVRMARVRS